jgi:Rod binding domain-containing protein
VQISPLTSTPPAADPSQFAERMNRLSPVEQRRVVAQQFEAILLRQLLAPALQTMPGSGNGIYSYMLTDAFAQKLSAGKGLGLAAVLQRQFTPPGERASAMPAASASVAGQKPSALLP